MKVRVYWNLHRRKWSIQQGGLVIDHRDSLFLTKANFTVREGGQKRVRESGQKNVHAFVCGEWDQKEYHTFKDMPLWRQVSYNPKRDNFFMVKTIHGYSEINRDFTYSVVLETENGKPRTYI